MKTREKFFKAHYFPAENHLFRKDIDMHEVIMPKLGLTMETGVIEKWLKKEGDKVESGEVLFEVMTDKVSLEVEAYHSGYLRKILKNEGEEVPVTEVIAYIGEKDEPLEAAQP